MADNNDLIQKIRTVVREEVKAETEPIKKDLQDVKQTQVQQGTILAQNTTLLEATASGQKELQKIVAKEADLLDLQSDLGKKVKDHEVRIENLEDHTGTHNPHKN